METMQNDYKKQASDFLVSVGAIIEIKFLKNGKHFEDDKDVRDIYEITISRRGRKYTFNFGQSIINSQYYKDHIAGRTYTLSGGCRTGNYSINDISKYKLGGDRLVLIKGVAPDAYDILACLQKNDVGSFDNFCAEFGYNSDSRKAEKTYKAVCEEYIKLCTIFSEQEMEQLQQIQ